MAQVFKAVNWMREQRTRIDKEDEGLSWEEKRKKTHNAVLDDPVLKQITRKIEVPSQLKVNSVKEKPSEYLPDSKDNNN